MNDNEAVYQEEYEDVGEEIELVPERNFWERSSPISLIPKPIARYFFMVKERFGVDIANIVLFAYKEWGEEIAIPFARKILEFETFEELIRFLQSRAKRLGEGKELLNSIIFSFQYNHHFTKLLEEKKKICPEAREIATEIFHQFASVGLFYAPVCIGQIAEVEAGCKEKVSKRCKRAYDAYIKLKERIGGGKKK